MHFSNIKLWKMDKDFIVVTSSIWHEKKLKQLNYHPCLTMCGARESVKLSGFLDKYKLLDGCLVFSKNKDNKESILTRVALGIEEPLKKIEQKKRKEKYLMAKERRKNRIIIREGIKFTPDKKEWLSCEICHRQLGVKTLNIIPVLGEGGFFRMDSIEYLESSMLGQTFSQDSQEILLEKYKEMQRKYKNKLIKCYVYYLDCKVCVAPIIGANNDDKIFCFPIEDMPSKQTYNLNRYGEYELKKLRSISGRTWAQM